ncbi:MAG: hypothetical protein N4A48_09045 [Tepidibacter sp.]|jgi:hypothetical protein|uniref:hypothetical protein n=1 Tax=Tepidibacter sp. TaxID=2529387 RepID=UPI0026000F2F|nr:hypothetical protein [Tepidibacter sp.]MCT4508892.1 hypothetical protein [Tepidibacter sp.]
MKLNKNLMALAIGVMTLASTAAPSFAYSKDSTSYKSVGDTQCKLVLTCTKTTCNTKVVCEDSVEHIEVHTKAWGDGKTATSSTATASYKSSCSDNRDPARLSGGTEVEGARGWAEVKDGGDTIRLEKQN